jgi:hypothetical protein
VERARHPAHRDLGDGLEREIHLERSTELEERRELGETAARLLQLHRVVVHLPSQGVELCLLVDHVEAEENREPDEPGQENRLATRGDVISQIARPDQTDVEGRDRA